MSLRIDRVYAWTDYTIVLHWLRKDPRSWKTFVCNRVAAIQSQLKSTDWHYITSNDNPANETTTFMQ